ncbi:VOC family protein [Amaricoccus sp.]|uniref:VOC family protein n=1 Tax=Amaricoccus sp. TaxID=1872485 RepID=UPI0026214326|nr:VOC family protein [Amaricoccus sp.]HRO10726.1 VOC family protein [Amaricoccus sp.]
MQKITPHLWYDSDAETAARTYVDLVAGSAIGSVVRYPEAGREIHGREPGSVMTVEFRLGDTGLIALNGGPLFQFTHAGSLFVTLEDRAAVDRLWEGLIEGGRELMPLDRYEWGEHYGWLADRWGLSWQVCLGSRAAAGRTITPSLLFGGEAAGRAQEAIDLYASALGARLESVMRHDGSGRDPAGGVRHARLTIDGQPLTIMESVTSEAPFTEAFSLLVNCEDQAEIDRLWSALSAVPEAEACGWLKDRFGVSWQIAPRALGEMMTSGDRAGVERLTAAFMKMKKLDLATLERAFAGAAVVDS